MIALYLIFLYLLCFLLSILSKENGILLITYTFSIISLQKNTTNNHQHKNSFFNEIIKFFSIALVLYILYVAFSQGHGRLFSVYERFLTETRIIWTYIYHIIIPKFNGTSLLQDDIAISKSIFNPISTFVAIISLL